MKNLTTLAADISKEGNPVTLRFQSTLDGGHECTDEKGVEYLVPRNVHTDLGFSKVAKGAVVQIVKTKSGHALFELEPEEVLAWENSVTKGDQLS